MPRILTNQGLFYESGQTPFAFAAMTHSGDQKTFTAASKPWSQRTNYAPVIAPYGLLTGGAVTPAAAGGNNNVDVAALTAMMPGATGASATTGVLSVSAATNVAASRGSSDGYRITSITVNSSGAIAAVSGTESTAFSETRGAAGGPPFIPVGSIEIAQVRFTSTSAAVVAAAEIYAVPGQHLEMSNLPTYSADYLSGKITFDSNLPLIHTGSVPKAVYVRGHTPIFAAIGSAKDWVPATDSLSAQALPFYRTTLSSVSSSMSAASFSVAFEDGVTDPILALSGENVMIKYMPDIAGTAYSLTQGVMGISITNPVRGISQGTVTLVAQQATKNYTS